MTSLTYNNRSRTLTCTSTGGPATTVTWRRNGVVITLNATHQQTKTLVNSVKGTYQTVLTIDSSVEPSGLVGNYSCTVGISSKSIVVTGKDLNLCTLHHHVSGQSPLPHLHASATPTYCFMVHAVLLLINLAASSTYVVDSCLNGAHIVFFRW